MFFKMLPHEMLSENVYQDLFLRAGEYLLDEQLISGQKMSKFAFSTA
jgi:hypothetical protein